MTITATRRTSATPDALWHLVSDVTRMGEWSPETASAAWKDGATGPAPGARFTGRNKRSLSWSTTCTVVTAEPGREFTFEVGKGETSWSYLFEVIDGQTEVTERAEILKQPGAVSRLLTRLAVGVPWSQREEDLRRGMEQTLARLCAAAEEHLPPPGAAGT